MKQRLLILILIKLFPISSFTQVNNDSLVRFSDLKYHSYFEKISLNNFFNYQKDTFNLFLAIDPEVTNEKAREYHLAYKKIIDDLNQGNIRAKKINKQIKTSYSSVHNLFLKKYSDNEYFPVIFQSGVYNCVSASMLYSLVFEELDIPYKIKVSSNHVYLVANPGSNSMVIETTNPGFEKSIFTGEFKQQYVNYLRTSKLISELDYKSKSVEEIFEEKFNEVKDGEHINLPGFQYYNKGLYMLQNNNFEEAHILFQKAFLFYPDPQVKTILYNSLLYQMDKCNYKELSDIDYLAQLSRFEYSDISTVYGIFNGILANFLQYNDKEEYCDSLCQRLVSQISDESYIEEISFGFNMIMSYRYQYEEKVEKYVTKALDIKGNQVDANIIMENFIHKKLRAISNPFSLLDTISAIDLKYDFECLTPLLADYKLEAYLRIANKLYGEKKIADAEGYLNKFEENCIMPFNSPMLGSLIENTYRSVALYYFYKGYKTKAKSYINRGLRYVPESRLLESAVY